MNRKGPIPTTFQNTEPFQKENNRPMEPTATIEPEIKHSQSLWQHRRAFAACLILTLSSITTGATITYTTLAIPDLNVHCNRFHLNSEQESWAGSMNSVGGMVGALVIGTLMDRYGRKLASILALVPVSLGSLIIVASINPWMLHVGRFLHGLSCGAAMICVPVYIAEAAPTAYRGILLSLDCVFINLGFLCTYVMGSLISWLWLAVFNSALSVIALVPLLFVPDTPYWLLKKKRRVGAEEALRWLRDTTNVQEELNAMESTETSQHDKEVALTLNDLKDPSLDHPLLLTIALVFFHTMTGVDALILYMVEVFRLSGTALDSYDETIVTGAIGIIGTIACSASVQYLGRRPILMISTSFTALSMGVFGLYFKLLEKHRTFVEANLYWLPLATMVVYMVAFNYGLGPISFEMIGELLPTRIRGIGGGLTVTLQWLFGFFLTKFFTNLKDLIHPYGVFWLFSVVAVLGFLFVFFILPETKDKTLDEIEQIFQKSKPPKSSSTVIQNSLYLDSVKVVPYVKPF